MLAAVAAIAVPAVTLTLDESVNCVDDVIVAIVYGAPELYGTVGAIITMPSFSAAVVPLARLTVALPAVVVIESDTVRGCAGVALIAAFAGMFAPIARLPTARSVSGTNGDSASTCDPLSVLVFTFEVPAVTLVTAVADA